MILASILTSFWDKLEAHHEQAVFLVLVGFLGSFAFIRMSTRIIRSESISWWPGNVESESGLHIHHLVFGIVAMLGAGTLGFVADGRSPLTEACAVVFGIGAGLTIDEFALWVRLEDVYWEQEGRSSIDAAVIVAALMLLLLVGGSPVVIESGSTQTLVSSIVGALIVVALVLVCLAKGRILHAVTGVFIPPIALYGAWRIGKPSSIWARRRYDLRRPHKQTKAEERFDPQRRTERFKEAFRDIVGGKPSKGLAAVRDQASAAAREAGLEVRAGAQRISQAGEAARRDRTRGD